MAIIIVSIGQKTDDRETHRTSSHLFVQMINKDGIKAKWISVLFIGIGLCRVSADATRWMASFLTRVHHSRNVDVQLPFYSTTVAHAASNRSITRTSGPASACPFRLDVITEKGVASSAFFFSCFLFSSIFLP